MAQIYRRVKGRKTEQFLARLPGVQDELDARMFEIAVRAESLLKQHRAEGHAQIEVAEGDIDRYVVLSDERGQKAALSIEYGREAYSVEREINGETVTVNVGAMEGLFILHRAANLSKQRRSRVRLSASDRRRM